MPSRRNASAVPAAPVEATGRGIIGMDRIATPEAMDQRTRQSSGMPPAGARDVPQAAEPVTGLPGVHVSRQLVGREIQRLKGRAESIERQLGRGFFGVSGQVVPHLVEAHRAAQADLERIRAEIARLDSLTELEARQWAAEHEQR